MTTPNAAQEIETLEKELKKAQDEYLYAENEQKNALATMRSCKDTIIAIQTAIDVHKRYVPEEAGEPVECELK